MVRIGDVWEEATGAVRGRLDAIAPIAAATIFLPNIVQTAFTAYSPSAQLGPGRALLGFAVALGTLVIALFGGMAITALVCRSDLSGADARRLSASRLGPMIGVTLALAFAATLVFIPVVIALASSGLNFAALGQGAAVAALGASRGALTFAGLYALVALGVLLWAAARLMPVSPIVLFERRSLGAIGRAFALTRGMGARLVGVALLYYVVLAVAVTAARFLAGTVFGLVLGGGSGTSLFLSGAVAAAAATIFSVLANAFISRLYVALTGRADHQGLAETFA